MSNIKPFLFLFFLFLCAACSDDDSPRPEKELPVINYFRGTVNGQYVCFECHDRYICPIDINTMSYWPGESIPVEFTVGIPIPPVENLENGGRLYFKLTPARTGLYGVSVLWPMNMNRSGYMWTNCGCLTHCLILKVAWRGRCTVFMMPVRRWCSRMWSFVPVMWEDFTPMRRCRLS